MDVKRSKFSPRFLRCYPSRKQNRCTTPVLIRRKSIYTIGLYLSQLIVVCGSLNTVMKIHELLEAQDYQRIADPSLKWLAQYTYENLNKWPGAHIVQDLLHRFPCDAGVIYRGMNFYTQEKYDEFMQQFKGAQTASIEFGSITSWSESKSEALQFAVTQPTYFLNREVMVAHGEMQAQKERLSGYRGIILSMQVAQGEGIDVNKSGVGHESEVILPPGMHSITIHEQIKKYADQIVDKDVDINQAILSMKVPDMKKSTGDSHSLFDYVMHHHVQELNSQARDHLFQLFKPAPNADIFVHKSEPSDSYGDIDSNKVMFQYWTPCYFLFELYEKGVFEKPAHVSYIKNLAKRIMREAMPVFEKNLIPAEHVDMRLIKQVAQIAGAEDQFTRMLRRTVGAEYQRLQDEGRQINQIKNSKEQEQAMRLHAEKLKQLFSKMR